MLLFANNRLNLEWDYGQNSGRKICYVQHRNLAIITKAKTSGLMKTYLQKKSSKRQLNKNMLLYPQDLTSYPGVHMLHNFGKTEHKNL